MTIPTYLPYHVLIGSVAIIVAILFGLRNALANSGWSEQDRTVAFRWSATVLIGWFLLAIALALGGAYQAGPERIPTIQYGIALPILIGSWLLWRSPAVSRIIDAVPQPWIVAVQLYRALGVIFLIFYANGRMPGLFAWPAGVGDIIVGLAAPIGAGLRTRPTQKRRSCWGMERLWVSILLSRSRQALSHPLRYCSLTIRPTSLLAFFRSS